MSNIKAEADLLAELLWRPQPRDEASVFLLGDLAQLPADELVALHQEGHQVEQETVSHVEDAADLGEDNPDQTEPPELHCGKHGAQDVAKGAGEQVTNYVLDGVTWQTLLVVSSRPARSVLTSIFSTGAIIAPDPLEDEWRVADDLPGQLHGQGGQEAKDPVVDVICPPDEVEKQPCHHQTEAVRVKDVARGSWRVPLPDIQRPPASFVPSHF